MTQFTLVRHSRYAEAADPNFEDAIEVCVLNAQQAYRVRAAGGALYVSRQAAMAAAGGRGHFSSLSINGAEIFIHAGGPEKLDGLADGPKGPPSGEGEGG